MRYTYLAPAIGAFALLVAACGGDESSRDPASTVEAYIAEYNAGNLDGVMAIFDEDATMTGHPFDPQATGRDEIRFIHADEVGGPGRYAISNVETSGNIVTWDHVWGGEDDGEPFEFCVEGLSATIEEGQITFWKWPDTDFQCNR